ncbi:FixH family protein [Ferviditalea candida]|uniref:FixH family protein n=1 Tax=Ferviditalea candida TaxID=3108399 RepID=A0ABU5ZH96_9BACL|nr:FixH family protein [Paenibacillaceae bacterium T2]
MKTYSHSLIGLFFVLFTSILLSSCSNHHSNPNPDTGILQIAATNSKYHISINLSPNPTQILHENNMIIRIRDNAGHVIHGANVSVSVSMEEMDHGNLNFAVIPSKNGEYVARVTPVMQGTWIADVTAMISHERATAKYAFKAVRSIRKQGI